MLNNIKYSRDWRIFIVLFCFSLHSNADWYIEQVITLKIKKVMKKMVKSPSQTHPSIYEGIVCFVQKFQAWMRFFDSHLLWFCFVGDAIFIHHFFWVHTILTIPHPPGPRSLHVCLTWWAIPKTPPTKGLIGHSQPVQDSNPSLQTEGPRASS